MSKFGKYALIVVIIVVIGWLFASGRFSADEAKSLGRRAYYEGRNVVEKVKEAPGNDNSFAAASQCRENLRLIESAKRKVAADKGQTSGGLTVQEVEAALGGSFPACPSGGTYTIGPLIQLPTCSIGPQGNLEARDDHVLHRY